MPRYWGLLLPLAALCLPAAAQETYGSVSAGYTYLNAEAPTGARTGLNGWYAIGTFNVSKKIGILADFTNAYGGPSGGSENVHGFTFGPIYNFKNHSRITPVAFTEIGDVRDSVAGTVTSAFAFVVGGGFAVKLNPHVNLQIIPAEYVLTAPSTGVLNNYNAKFGLEFPIGKK